MPKLDGNRQRVYINDMMRCAHNEAPACDSDLRQALEKAGCRLTRQRAAVFNYLRSVNSHPTAEQVCLAVRQQIPDISLATVYKALETLVEARLATKLSDSDGPARYDCRSEAHYHLHCVKTGQVRDLPTPYDPTLLDKLDPLLLAELQRQGFQVTGHRLELVGYFVNS